MLGVSGASDRRCDTARKAAGRRREGERGLDGGEHFLVKGEVCPRNAELAGGGRQPPPWLSHETIVSPPWVRVRLLRKAMGGRQPPPP